MFDLDIDPIKPLPWRLFDKERPTVAVLVCHPYRSGVLLVQPYKDDSHMFYMLPQGGIEIGESVIEAARRELREEVKSFAREHGKGNFKVDWSSYKYFGAASNPKARSGLPKRLHVVAFKALVPTLTFNPKEVTAGTWVFDAKTVGRLMEPTKTDNYRKWRITMSALVAAHKAGALILPR